MLTNGLNMIWNNPKFQKGASSLMVVIVASAIGLATTKYLQDLGSMSQKTTNMRLVKSSAEDKCVEAIELANQILGSGLLKIEPKNTFSREERCQGDVLKYNPNDKENPNWEDLRFDYNPCLSQSIIENRGLEGSENFAETWGLESDGTIQIRGCLSPNFDDSEIFTNESASDTSNLRVTCSDEREVFVAIKPHGLIMPDQDANKFTNLSGLHASVSATCRIGQGEAKTLWARFKVLPLAQTCDYSIPQTRSYCSIDHCRYMTPVRSGLDNSIKYVNDQDTKDKFGTGYAVYPNPKYSESIEVPDTEGLVSSGYDALKTTFIDVDSNSKALYANKFFCPNLVHPFKGWRAILPEIEYKNYLEENDTGTGYIIDILPGSSYKNNPTYNDDNVNYENNLSNLAENKFMIAEELPLNETDEVNVLFQNLNSQEYLNNEDYRNKLHAACKQFETTDHNGNTITPDFCQKVELLAADMSIKYKAQEKCTLYGPNPNLTANHQYKHVISSNRNETVNFQGEEVAFKESIAQLLQNAGLIGSTETLVDHTPHNGGFQWLTPAQYGTYHKHPMCQKITPIDAPAVPLLDIKHSISQNYVRKFKGTFKGHSDAIVFPSNPSGTVTTTFSHGVKGIPDEETWTFHALNFASLAAPESNIPTCSTPTSPSKTANVDRLLRVVACNSDLIPSEVTEQAYIKLLDPQQPIIEKNQAGNYIENEIFVKPSLRADYEQNFVEEIRYTLNGTNPTCGTGELVYSNNSADISLSAPEGSKDHEITLKMIACDLFGQSSGVYTAKYTLNQSVDTVNPKDPTYSFSLLLRQAVYPSQIAPVEGSNPAAPILKFTKAFMDIDNANVHEPLYVGKEETTFSFESGETSPRADKVLMYVVMDVTDEDRVISCDLEAGDANVIAKTDNFGEAFTIARNHMKIKYMACLYDLSDIEGETGSRRVRRGGGTQPQALASSIITQDIHKVDYPQNDLKVEISTGTGTFVEEEFQVFFYTSRDGGGDDYTRIIRYSFSSSQNNNLKCGNGASVLPGDSATFKFNSQESRVLTYIACDYWGNASPIQSVTYNKTTLRTLGNERDRYIGLAYDPTLFEEVEEIVEEDKEEYKPPMPPYIRAFNEVSLQTCLGRALDPDTSYGVWPNGFKGGPQKGEGELALGNMEEYSYRFIEKKTLDKEFNDLWYGLALVPNTPKAYTDHRSTFNYNSPSLIEPEEIVRTYNDVWSAQITGEFHWLDPQKGINRAKWYDPELEVWHRGHKHETIYRLDGRFNFFTDCTQIQPPTQPIVINDENKISDDDVAGCVEDEYLPPLETGKVNVGACLDVGFYKAHSKRCAVEAFPAVKWGSWSDSGGVNLGTDEAPEQCLP